MEFNRTDIPDIIVCKPAIHGDHRGYFVETFREDDLEAFLGYRVRFCQDNESKSSRGVLRGLHYQLAPHAQTKLVRVIAGRILDVAVDLRKGSPTFGKHVAIELNDVNKFQLFVPRGFAHGFVVLEEGTIVAYKVDSYYAPESDRGLAYDDEDLGIDWRLPFSELQLSPKDTVHPKLKELETPFAYGSDHG